jgi:hypothetical protein
MHWLCASTIQKGAYLIVAFPTADPFRPRNGETKAKCKYKLVMVWLAVLPWFPRFGDGRGWVRCN